MMRSSRLFTVTAATLLSGCSQLIIHPQFYADLTARGILPTAESRLVRLPNGEEVEVIKTDDGGEGIEVECGPVRRPVRLSFLATRREQEAEAQLAREHADRLTANCHASAFRICRLGSFNGRTSFANLRNFEQIKPHELPSRFMLVRCVTEDALREWGRTLTENQIRASGWAREKAITFIEGDPEPDDE